MGAVYAEITLTNAEDQGMVRRGALDAADIRSVVVVALADSGATILVIPDSLRDQLGLPTVGHLLVSIADGGLRECDMVGPVEVRFGDRTMRTDAAVMPDDAQVLLGQVQMEQMDLVIDPLAQRLIPSPASPDRARLMAVGMRVHGPANSDS